MIKFARRPSCSRRADVGLLESFLSALLSRVKVAHPNYVFAFLAHLQRATLDSQADVRRASRA